MSHVPTRQCVGCGSRRPRPELVRLVASGDQILVDSTGGHGGRGAYLCAGDACACLARAQRRRALGRSLTAFHGVIDYSELERQLRCQESPSSLPLRS